MDRSEQRKVVEALIMASSEPVSADRLARIVPQLKAAGAKDLVNELNTEYQETGRAFEVWEVAGGFQLRTLAEFSGYLQQLRKERPLRLSQAALETLSIIAYKQPVTRADLEDVRGVDTGAVVRGLLDRRLLRIAGHKDVPGRPLLYGTSRRFLEVFGLESIKDLPALRELEELAREQGVVLPGSGSAEGDQSTAGDEAVQEELLSEEGIPVIEVAGEEVALEGDAAPEIPEESQEIHEDLDVGPVIESVEGEDPKDGL
ncbi:MAG: SMC-Scp complex subunit ScpB [Spirochaeta sp.]|nr:SMC-Scp complex subunit ScpB [Spirochaeta sp.]RPG10910.1 MAG: SMC-Scp complex subunit ScpB [Proteobacteria bacterium TMED72]